MLYIVSTPIGNLSDISLRAIEVLKSCDVILAEDGRRTRRLLDFLDIKGKKIESYYEQVEEEKLAMVAEMLDKDMEVVLLTNAGTPLVSDPGFKLVNMCRKKGYSLTAVPGPVAAINALVLSGFPMDKFIFLGFLPKKTGKRIRVLEEYKTGGTKVVYESPNRLVELLKNIEQVFGRNSWVCVCREMTKKFEEVKIGSVDELIDYYQKEIVKGEITVVFI